MLSPKRLVEKARKGIFHSVKSEAHLVADKGHFIVYTEDGTRFMVPLAFLGNPIFQELLKVSEDEFGLPGDRPITLPCNASFMEYVLSLLKRRMAKDSEIMEIMVLFGSLGANHCRSSITSKAGFCQQHLVVP